MLRTQSRRSFLHRAGSLAIGAAALPLLGACGGDEPAAAKRLAWFSFGGPYPPAQRVLLARLEALGYGPLESGSRRLELTAHVGPPIGPDSPNARDLERLAQDARQIVSGRPDVIVTSSREATAAAASATSELPVLFFLDTDPVAGGLVQSMAATGRNLTGVFEDNYGEVAGKRVELLKECFPAVTRVAILRDPRSNTAIDATTRAAQALGLSVLVVEVTSAEDLIPAVLKSIGDGADAVLPAHGGAVAIEMNRILPLQDFLIQKRLPAVWDAPYYVNLRRGLMFYGPDRDALYQRLAEKVVQVFEGARPEDLPVERPRLFSLIFNLTTAREMGVTIPPSVLARATEVIT